MWWTNPQLKLLTMLGILQYVYLSTVWAKLRMFLCLIWQNGSRMGHMNKTTIIQFHKRSCMTFSGSILFHDVCLNVTWSMLRQSQIEVALLGSFLPMVIHQNKTRYWNQMNSWFTVRMSDPWEAQTFLSMMIGSQHCTHCFSDCESTTFTIPVTTTRLWRLVLN